MSAKKKKDGDILVIVESPSKARTISKYLGKGYVVESSIGHIRDLPSGAAEIPETLKGESWARLGVNVEEDFEPLYIVPASKKAQVRKLKSHLKDAAALYLATDEDREGEAIAWHLAEVLKPKVPIRRMVFDEITKAAITDAVSSTREINDRLVSAQETRRILDRLFGYEVSPVLWRKVGPKLSAGRVQSVATRLVVDRERERMKFREAEYWDIEAKLQVQRASKESFGAKLIDLDGRRIAIGKDFENETGKLRDGKDVCLLNGTDAQSITDAISSTPFTVAQVNEKPFTNRPYAPFITSTLQQEAARKLRFSAQRTMSVAQSLYENGFITYMRTDSTTLSSQAISAARQQVTDLYGSEYLPDQPRTYTKKSKNAQEAHEAIRPAGDECRTPKSIESELNEDAFRLYELIWKRTVASQMKDAAGMRTSIRLEVDTPNHGRAGFTASGKVIKFPGFLRAYVEGSDDPEAELEDQEKILPAVAQGEQLDPKEINAQQHLTQPPARYTEASLIKELEDRGIGRPSTYAAIIQTIQDRGYVWRKGTALVPTFTAFAVTNLLSRHLPSLVDYDFTAKMEGDLDAIANGECESKPWLKSFYFGGRNGNGSRTKVESVGLKALVASSGEDIDARAVSCIPIGETESKEPVVVRVGRYGPYIQIGEREHRASVPNDIAPDSLTIDRAVELIEQAAQGDKVIGEDPASGKPVYIKTGRFGPYVQLGDPELTPKGNVKRGTAPRRASLWPSMSMESLTFEEAMQLLSFPKDLGEFPDTKEVITVQDGRFGPYIKSGTETRSLPDHEKMASLTLDEAIAMLREPKRRGRNAAASMIADLGKRPNTEDPVQVKNGRYGPYVTDGVVNATIPKGTDPKSVTLEKAVELLVAREEKMRDQGKDPRAPKKKATRKKATKKKAAKKTTAKKTAKKETTKKKAAKTKSAKKKSTGAAMA
ncbi:MAG: type I DNA topoisomerase [Planctomycetota bacterium]|jgi:DNA topoisomerase-1